PVIPYFSSTSYTSSTCVFGKIKHRLPIHLLSPSASFSCAAFPVLLFSCCVFPALPSSSVFPLLLAPFSCAAFPVLLLSCAVLAILLFSGPPCGVSTLLVIPPSSDPPRNHADTVVSGLAVLAGL